MLLPHAPQSRDSWRCETSWDSSLLTALFLANKGAVLARAAGTITNKASSLQIYIKLGRTLLYNDMQTPVPLFPRAGTRHEGLPSALWRARPHTLSPTGQALRQVPVFH